MTDWIKTEDELPPHDCRCEITNDIVHKGVLGTAYYDGYGFIFGGQYRNPIYWRPAPIVEKKYGKQK